MEKFDLQEITNNFETEGIHVIPAYALNLNISLLFMGDFKDFISTIKAIGAKSVVMEKHVLVESDFFEEWEDEIHGNYPGADESSNQVYLPMFLPELKDYERYTGEIHYLRILVFYQSQILSYMHETPLYSEIERLKEKAIEKFEGLEEKAKQEHERELSRNHEANAKIKEELLKKLGSLLEDGRFAKLGTQRAMQAYAIEVFPDLVEMDPYDLKNEIQNLSDRIKARKLLG